MDGACSGPPRSDEPIDANMVFAVFPNGRVCLYHQVQGKDLGIDPLTGQRFTVSTAEATPWLPGPSGTGDGSA